jgi:Uma2 family endonuclease
MAETAGSRVSYPVSSSVASRQQKQALISWELFQQKYLTREDNFKYEWVDGLVVKTVRGIDKSQLYILHNLQAFFRQLQNNGKIEGDLIAEPDLFFLSNHRRPDIAWLTQQQIYNLAEPEAYEVPRFLIEIVSTNDQINKVKAKMINYAEAGVEVVWQVFPAHRQVDVYSGTFLHQMTVCRENDICTAAPTLPDFQLSVNEIFFKPERK